MTNEKWWEGEEYAFEIELITGDDPVRQTVYYVPEIVAEAERRGEMKAWEEARKMMLDNWIIKQDHIIPPRKPTHGTCCTCQKCGYSNTDGDECYCASNELNALIDAKLTELKK